jgi:uncharacterized protein (TIGR03435 family)
MMKRAATLFLIFIHAAACAQTKSPPPEFDAAVVKLNKSGAVEPSGGILPGGEFSARNISMVDLLQFAYKVDGSAISGFQPWFRSDRFDVIAKGPVNTSSETLSLMLQNLLAREFKLKVHEERKPQDAFALVVATGGPKLQRAADPAPPPSGAANSQFDDPVDPCKRTTDSTGIHADCANISMEALAKRLTSLAPAYLDRPVVDLTGISGTYDLKLQWTGKGKIDAEGGLTIFDAVTKQLGLKLEQRKVPLPGIAIDHVERLTEN